MATCNHRDSCEREVYADDLCTLHCKKNDYQKDRHSGLLSDFYNEFVNYIVEKLLKYEKFKKHVPTKQSVVDYLKSNKFDNKEFNDNLKSIVFAPTEICFPTRDGKDYFDYLKILNLFGEIHFNYCEFYLSYLELKEVKCFFQDCKFHNRWTLCDYGLLENEDGVIYQTCLFKGKVSNYTPDESNELAIYKHSQFDFTCEFKDSIEFDRVKFESMLFNTNQHNYLDDNSISKLKLDNCTFENKFILNNYDINEFTCKDTIFKDKFEFKENKIKSLFINNSNFDNLFDLYGGVFEKFKIVKSIFDDFAGFEECTFGSEKKLKEEIAIFKYATFTDFLNFRNTKFLSGLDIENINLKEAPNFLNTKVELKNTNRETFRILKHSFDSIGNIIDANKFYQKEMEKREEELKKEKNYFEWIVFKIHDISSKHSQDWFLALFWIINFTLIFSHFEYIWCEDKTEYIVLPFILSILIFSFLILEKILYKKIHLFDKLGATLFLYGISSFFREDFKLKDFSTIINPFSIMNGNNILTFSTLIYKVVIAYLMYQLIISIRQNTRRK